MSQVQKSEAIIDDANVKLAYLARTIIDVRLTYSFFTYNSHFVVCMLSGFVWTKKNSSIHFVCRGSCSIFLISHIINTSCFGEGRGVVKIRLVDLYAHLAP
mmetsp:Transcript_24409/g.37665  ORF Transcript_24409/g.37665 Transcript_24409/m.37665 type:complete len:101 (-) Transcript_24409:5-307(-)